MHELKLWKFILERLNKDQPVILLCVPESKGSSPGRQGFKMAVAEDDMTGSIGGGIMEHKFAELAKEKLKQEKYDMLLRKQYHDKSASENRSGMICSGEQVVLLYRVQKEDANHIENLIHSLDQNKNGKFRLSPKGIDFSDEITSADFHFNMQSETEWEFEEKTGYKNHLFIIGGGHCALAFSRMMSVMDFYIHLYEDRKNLNTYLQNDFVHKKNIIDNYSLLRELIPSGSNHYVVIMTFGYRTDDIALRSLLDKNFKYLGVLGSKSKMEQLFAELRKDGITEEKIKTIYSPIGIPIKSQTPQEIAVSIAAEIIKIKNAAF